MPINEVGKKGWGTVLLVAGLFFGNGAETGAAVRRNSGTKFVATVEEFSGKVMIKSKKDAEWKNVVKGMGISSENEIKTEQGRVKISLGAKNSLKILETSQIKLEKSGVELLQGALRVNWTSQKVKKIFSVSSKNIQAEISDGVLESWINSETDAVVMGSVKGNIKVTVSLEGKTYPLVLQQNLMVVIPKGSMPGQTVGYTPSPEPSIKLLPSAKGGVVSPVSPLALESASLERSEGPEPVEASSFQPTQE